MIKTDCAVIGGGIAGCPAALDLADAGYKVSLFYKGDKIEECNSGLIAGGVRGERTKEGIEKHFNDTMKAGSMYNDPKVVRYFVENFYPRAIKYLIDRVGVEFDEKDGEYDLSNEGSLTEASVFHWKDKTGVSIMKSFDKHVREHPNITVYENHLAIDLITKDKINNVKGDEDECYGFYVYDMKNDEVKTVSCKGTFVATGGLGKVFTYTSNSDVSTGDGYAMCYRAGLPLANMEFVQFHPSVFYDPTLESESERRFLLTEALRSDGAFLKLDKDAEEDFVLKYDDRGSRAPRDIVSRAEDKEMRENNLDHVWLDCTKVGEELLKTKFRNSHDFCLSKGIDITKEPVPVVYAAHYSVGGVLTGIHGETKIKGCYVLGETGHTGLHDANRLPCNSGPECIVVGRNAAEHFLERYDSFEQKDVPLWDVGKAEILRDKATVSYFWDIIRNTNTKLCGVSRKRERLRAAKRVIRTIKKDIKRFYWKHKLKKNFLEARNLAYVADAILKSALFRKESAGCHSSEDFPESDEKYFGWTIVERGREPYLKMLIK